MSVHDGSQTNPIPVRDLLARIRAENLVISYHRLTAAGRRHEAARLRADSAARAARERRRQPARLLLDRRAVRHLYFITGLLAFMVSFVGGLAYLDAHQPTGYAKACISCHGAVEQPSVSAS